MRVQRNIKSVQLTRQFFVHNTWSGMLIIAGSEKGESPSRTLTINLSPLHPWKNRERGSRVKAIGWCLWRDTSDRFTRTPFSEFLPSHTCYISPTTLHLARLTFIHLVLSPPLFLAPWSRKRRVNRYLHESKKNKMHRNKSTRGGQGCSKSSVGLWGLGSR